MTLSLGSAIFILENAKSTRYEIFQAFLDTLVTND